MSNELKIFTCNLDDEEVSFMKANLPDGNSIEKVDDSTAFIGEYYFLGIIKQNEGENHIEKIANYLRECNMEMETIAYIGKLHYLPKGEYNYIKVYNTMDSFKEDFKKIVEFAKERYIKCLNESDIPQDFDR